MSSQKNYSEQELLVRISELETEIKHLKKQKKYGLVWEDHTEDVVLECQENIPTLKEVKNRKIVDKDITKTTNLLIEGDNYHTLSVLNYTHKGKVDVIYIDPPYNTGNKDFIYNDNYIDRDDAYRHSKWLSFMEKRLRLAKGLLSDSGVIFISIDDNEQAQLKLLCDNVFGELNFIAILPTVMNLKGNQDQFGFAGTHEYTLVYTKNRHGVTLNHFYTETENLKNWSRDENGFYKLGTLKGGGANGTREKRPNLFFPIFISKRNNVLYTTENDIPIFKEDTAVYPISNNKETTWRWSKDKIKNEPHNVIFELRNNNVIFYRKIRPLIDDTPSVKPKSLFYKPEYSSGNGTALLKNMFDVDRIFNNPKPILLIKDLLHIGSKLNSTILDFMAGSGTTGHAVLELNKQDGGNRKFILCTNNENKICEEVTYERIKRVIKGYTNKKGEKVEGLGGNLSYYKTDLVNIEKLHKVSDDARIKVAYQAGEIIAIREDTLNEIEKNEWWQIFEGNGKVTAIYFKENKDKLQELINILEKKKVRSTLYIFGWGKNEYRNEYSTQNIKVEDIPEPILEVYKEINRL